MYETSDRPAKRARNDFEEPSDQADTSEDLTRDDEFWLVDGNIVLIAGEVAFKVYKGLLAEQSPVFSDVFLSASLEVSQLFERVPVVHLSDSPEDLRHFLRALLPNKQRSFVLFLSKHPDIFC